MGSIVLNLTSFGPAARGRLNGRIHLRIPVVALVPGVLPGSRGALLYPADEVARTHRSWEGTPLTLRHPHSSDGRPVSAAGAGVLDRFGVGVLKNVGLRGRDGALRGEAWFDEERLRSLDPVIYGHVAAGRPVEVSTGLYTDNVPAPPGARCPRTGRGYAAVARNYRPDHLAVLPDQHGACSVRDGCGLNVNARRPTVNALRGDGSQSGDSGDYEPHADADPMTRAADDLSERAYQKSREALQDFHNTTYTSDGADWHKAKELLREASQAHRDAELAHGVAYDKADEEGRGNTAGYHQARASEHQHSGLHLLRLTGWTTEQGKPTGNTARRAPSPSVAVRHKHLFGVVRGGVRRSAALTRNYARGDALAVVDALTANGRG